jgi:capsular polysaccharide biosynthesis protein
VIPRLHLLKQSGLTINKLIVNKSKQPFQSETLYQLGIKKDQLLITNNDFHIQAENLIIPSQPSFPTKWGYDVLKKAFLGDAKHQSPNKKRIFITRRWSRKITNEDQVMELLAKYSFVKFELDSLSVTEQVQLFSSAEIIIAAHGAALTNLTFCNHGTKVLEIFPPSYIIPHYWGISSVAKLEYHYFIGINEEKDSQMLKRWPGGDNITINIPEFKAYLTKMKL